jgi:hypothetical protein
VEADDGLDHMVRTPRWGEVRPAGSEPVRPRGRPTHFGELNELLGQLVLQARSILGHNFVGAYLQGSFALGDADLYSDCDFLIVLEGRLTPIQERRVRELHAAFPVRPEHWAQHLEGSYAPRDELRSLSGLGREWLFVDHGHREMEWSPHCNTEVVRWILREHGVTLAGPDPKALIDEVGPDVLRARMRQEVGDFLPGMLSWIKLDSPWAQRYAVTTLCRILYTLEMGEVASKRASLLWAKDTLDPRWQSLIAGTLEDRSLGWNHADPLRPGALEATLAFNDYARQRALRSG